MLTVSKAGYASPQPFPITIQINAGKIRIDGLPTRYMSVNDESARFK
ncbi:hypothetical protein FACS1894166_13120 [Bacilli bacterium]|nr:hypothetical protein FACS1894166_13120 [Bacilli bacterium]